MPARAELTVAVDAVDEGVARELNRIERGLDGLDGASRNVGASLSRFGGLAAAAGGAALAGIGAGAASLISRTLELRDEQNLLSLAVGANTVDAERFEEILKSIYADGSIAGGLSDIRRALQLVIRQFDEGNTDLETLTRNLLTFQQLTEEIYSNEQVVSTLRVGVGAFGEDPLQLLDLLAQQSQRVNDERMELADSVTEYGVALATAGFELDRLLAATGAGVTEGASRSYDIVFDVLNELILRLSELSIHAEAPVTAIENIFGQREGHRFIDDFNAGLITIPEAFSRIVDGLSDIQDENYRTVQGTALMGTQYEVVQHQGVEAMARVYAETVRLETSLVDINEVMRDSLTTEWRAFTREVEIGSAEIVGEHIPILQESFNRLAQTITGNEEATFSFSEFAINRVETLSQLITLSVIGINQSIENAIGLYDQVSQIAGGVDERSGGFLGRLFSPFTSTRQTVDEFRTYFSSSNENERFRANNPNIIQNITINAPTGNGEDIEAALNNSLRVRGVIP